MKTFFARNAPREFLRANFENNDNPFYRINIYLIPYRRPRNLPFFLVLIFLRARSGRN